jgi:RNA polymerase sigma factor (sigma-70 family)
MLAMLPTTPPSQAAAPIDPGAVGRAFAEQRPALVRYAERLLGDAARAEDVVQDTFVRLMAQPAEAVNGHTTEWLFTVCRHRALDVLRRENRLRHFEEGQMEKVVGAEERPGRSLEQTETRDAVLQLVDRLPRNQQEVVRLKFQHGFSYKEIARITSLSVSNVGFMIHTAVQRLRSELAAQQP